MHVKFLVAACVAAFSTAAAAGPFDQFKGKMKPGLYEVTMEMDMPGMPAGMGKQTMQNCVTEADLEQGKMGKNDQMPKGCEVQNVKVSGNTATYTTVCKGDMNMTADTTVNFRDNGYSMVNKTAMKQGGQTMNMTQKMEGRYVGPCTK